MPENTRTRGIDRKTIGNEIEKFLGDIRIHAVSVRPGTLCRVDVEASPHTEVVAVGVSWIVQPARTRVGRDDRNAEFSGHALCASLDDKIFFSAGESRQPEQDRNGAFFGRRRQVHAEAHDAAGFGGLVAVYALLSAKALVLRNGFHGHFFVPDLWPIRK